MEICSGGSGRVLHTLLSGLVFLSWLKAKSWIAVQTEAENEGWKACNEALYSNGQS